MYRDKEGNESSMVTYYVVQIGNMFLAALNSPVYPWAITGLVEKAFLFDRENTAKSVADQVGGKVIPREYDRQ